MITKDIYLVRHGKVQGASALYGRTDVAVADEEQQRLLHRLNQRNLAVNGVFSSPLSRCYNLAMHYAMKHHWDLNVLADFQEIDFGILDGVAFDRMEEKQPWFDVFSRDPVTTQIPQGESLSQFHQRVTTQWQALIERNESSLLVVTHGGVIRLLVAHALGMDWRNPGWFHNLALGYGTLTHIRLYIEDAAVASDDASHNSNAHWHSVLTIGEPL
ncbi:alpha-ribazole phosphatase [Vibrio sp. SM6]|uniref:Alpha-ribazole phosphatase n=1 Tax=Vibrio agarilyticus TaxID=2726741 RepID=A0A7X8TQF8_9VIBR|nr:alpha-ribazole phosphatase [Vibrio agarilyticus]